MEIQSRVTIRGLHSWYTYNTCIFTSFQISLFSFFSLSSPTILYPDKFNKLQTKTAQPTPKRRQTADSSEEEESEDEAPSRKRWVCSAPQRGLKFADTHLSNWLYHLNTDTINIFTNFYPSHIVWGQNIYFCHSMFVYVCVSQWAAINNTVV